MKLFSKIDIPHLILTLLLTLVSACVLTIILIIIPDLVPTNLDYNEFRHFIYVITIELCVFLFISFILYRNFKKINLNDSRKSFSYLISFFILTIVFIYYVHFPLQRLLKTNYENRDIYNEAEKDKMKIETFIKDHKATDSFSNEQIDKLVDTLGNGWKRVDTTRNR